MTASSNADIQENRPATVSVVISCYNAERFIVETIESVRTQSYKNYEIIAIDDGSTDNTKALVRNYPEIKYIYQTNKGATSARNRGLDESQGKYIIFLDHDDKLLPERLKSGVDYLEANINCAFVLGWFDYIDSMGIVFDKATGYLNDVDYKAMLEGKTLVSPSGCMFRKEHLTTVGGFDPNTDAGDGEDYELYLKLSRQHPFYFQNETVWQYRRHDNNASTNNGSLKTMRAILRVLDKQRNGLKNEEEIISYKMGKQHWRELLGPRVVGEFIVCLKEKKIKQSIKTLLFLLTKCPLVTAEQLSGRILKNMRSLFSMMLNIISRRNIK